MFASQASISLTAILVVLAIIIIWLYRESTKSSTRFRVLEIYSKDLTAMARQGKLDPVVGRQHQIERVIQILTRRTKNNPVLIGKSGVGKTAIVEELAMEIASGRVPQLLQGKRVLALDLSGLVAGTKYRGEFEKRLKSLVDEIISAQRNIILFIDEMHTLAEAGEASGAIDAADILKPALSKGELQVVGATTMENYKNYIEKDLTLERRFQPVMVEEPDKEKTLEMLKGIRPRYEQHHGTKISDEALAKAVELADRHIHDRVFPDKAIDLVDEACAKVRLQAVQKNINNIANETLRVEPKDIEEILNEWKAEWKSESSLRGNK